MNGVTEALNQAEGMKEGRKVQTKDTSTRAVAFGGFWVVERRAGEGEHRFDYRLSRFAS